MVTLFKINYRTETSREGEQFHQNQKYLVFEIPKSAAQKQSNKHINSK